MFVKFNELPVGAKFICSKGLFVKLKNGADKFNGNAQSINFNTTANIMGSLLCRVIE